MRTRFISVPAAIMLLAVSAHAVSADALVADGDGLSPVAASRIDLGTICHAETTRAPGLVAVRATGHPNGRQVFDNGAVVTMTATILFGDGLAASSASPTVVMAADWRSEPNQSLAAPIAWDVAVTPDVLGRYRGRVEFAASGLNRFGDTITRITRLNVWARVVDCAPPVFADVPGDLVLEADGPDGAEVTFVPPTATDAVDGPVSVACDGTPGSLMALGATTMTCATEDAAGNVATASFTVLVADTTAPMIAAMPVDITAVAEGSEGRVVEWVSPTAGDIVDGTLPVDCLPGSQSLFPIGTTTVVCTTADAAGNVTSASFDVIIAAPPAAEPQLEEQATDPTVENSVAEHSTVESDEPAAHAPVSLVPAPPAGAVLPDTSMSSMSTATTALGLVALAAAGLAVTRRRTR